MKKLVLYGHPLGVDDVPVELSEVSLATTPKNLRKIAAHLLEVAVEMESMGETFDHRHMQTKIGAGPDIVICPFDEERHRTTKLKIVMEDGEGMLRRVPRGKKPSTTDQA